jgi:NADH-quinone oxidoreductase subunit C
VNPHIVEKLTAQFPKYIQGSNEFRGDLTICVAKDGIVEVCRFLKNDPELSFDLLVDLCGVDLYRPEGRFEVIYNLYSIKYKGYLRLKVTVDEASPVVDTVTSVWEAADWLERETYDMFGVTFRGHPDLRRMYMPEDYEYYPLRKDFPLMGVPDSIPLPRK